LGTYASRSDRAWTLGLNWYMNRFVKVQANVARESRDDAGAPIPGRARFWNRLLRVQFHL
jgi:hypothetical protein